MLRRIPITGRSILAKTATCNANHHLSSTTTTTTTTTTSAAAPSTALPHSQLRFASKASAGSTSNSKDSHSKRLGIKVRGGERVLAGGIIMRQVGNRYWPGYNVGQGRDYTLYALKDGWVQFVYDDKYDRIYITVSQELASVSQQRHAKASTDGKGKRETMFPDGQQRMVNRYGIPVKRIPGTQLHKIPKIKNGQIKYVVDRQNLKPQSYFKTHKKLPVAEPPRNILHKTREY